MRAIEVVLHEPLGEISVKECCVGGHVSQLDILFLQGSVEPFADGIVFWGMYSAVILGNAQLVTGLLEFTLEFSPIVVADVLDLSRGECMEACEEFCSIA